MSRHRLTMTGASARVRCLLTLLLLSAIGFGPVSITALIGMTVVLKRPVWFLRLALEVYGDTRAQTLTIPTTKPRTAWSSRLAALAVLTALMILDIAPFPVVGSLGLWIVGFRPAGFLRLVERIYGID